MLRPLWWVQQLVPPALLTYFGWCFYLCTFDIGPSFVHSHPTWGWIYTALPSVTIVPAASLYLRLYLIPRNQSVPPYDPPAEIKEGRVIFECLSPEEADVVHVAEGSGAGADVAQDSEAEELSAPQIDGAEGSSITSVAGCNLSAVGHEDSTSEYEDVLVDGDDREVLVNRCWRGRCNGRWKPARARHCSECGICRAGFDHHCPLVSTPLLLPARLVHTTVCKLPHSTAHSHICSPPRSVPTGHYRPLSPSVPARSHASASSLPALAN